MSEQKPTWGVAGGRPFNHYTCELCRMVTVSKDLADGVTPFLVKCHATVGCEGLAQSSVYRGPQNEDQKPHILWYAPTPDELTAYVRDLDPLRQAEVREHVSKGGLLMKKGERQPVPLPPKKLPWGTRPRQA